jgi:glycosyltransferase involved in cell wall biosynthesis
VNHVKASIIIPVYNAAPDMSALIAAIRATSLRDYEIIVVDDASTDGTADVCRADPDVRIVPLDVNAGPSRARNVGAAAARGDILIFLDSDVVLPASQDLLRDVVDGLEASPGADYVVTLSDIQPLARSAVAYNYSVYHSYYMERLLGGKEELRGPLMFFTTRLGAIWREKFRRTGGFYESLWTAMNEDGEFGARCYHLGYQGYCRARFVHSHRYSTGFSRFIGNYFLTAMVQALISAKMDTSPDPSIAAPEKMRRILAAALLAVPLLWLLLPARVALPLAATAAAVLLASFGRINALVLSHVPLRYRVSWYLVYVGITPAILIGYLYGALLHLTGRSLLKGRPSELSFFSAPAS